MKKYTFAFAILLPIVMSVFAGLSLTQLNNYKTAIKRIEFSETLVQLSKYMAQERGFTYVYAHLNDGGQDLVETISISGQQLDAYFLTALDYAEWLDDGDYQKLTVIRKQLQELRRIEQVTSADARIQLNGKSSIAAMEWFETVSGLISGLKTIHQANFERMEEGGKWLEMPATNTSTNTQKAIWDLFELAGRERALTGAAIAHGVAISQGKAKARWIKIHKAWREIRQTLQGATGNPELEDAIEATEKQFFADYGSTRQDVMAASSKGLAYPLGTKEWLAQSTRAIDSLINMTEILARNDIKVIAELNRGSEEIRKFISYSGIIVILVLAGSFAFYLIILITYRMRAKKVKKLYQISEKLLQVTSALALERGISRIAITTSHQMSDSLIRRVGEQRAKIDRMLQPALEDLQSLKIDKHNYLIEGVRKANRHVATLRKTADEYLQTASPNPSKETATTVFDGFTKLIESAEELQLSAAHSFALGGQKTGYWHSDSPWYQNLAETAALRHFIWMMSEFAGRQRALVGSAISSSSRVEDDKLAESQSIIQSSWNVVKLEISKENMDNTVHEVLDNVRKSFFAGAYPEMLNAVISCSSENPDAPCYDIETDKWFDTSSAAIAEILRLSNAVGANSERRLTQMINQETKRSVLVMGLSAISIGLMVLAINT